MLKTWHLFARQLYLRNIHSSVLKEISAAHGQQTLPVLEALDKDNARLIAIIDKRIHERNSLASKINDAGAVPPDVQASRRLKNLDELYTTWTLWQKTRKMLVETATLLEDEDPDIRTLAIGEYESLLQTHNNLLHEKFPGLLVSSSQTSAMSALLEIKPGVGGSESSLFLAELLRMYSRFASLRGWAAKIVVKDEREGGGMKSAILEIIGEGAYDRLRWESGVHRVQRVPATESGGRVHTSTVQILVLPLSDEAPESQPGSEKLFDDKDVRIEVMRARGAGGQHVNKTESAVRLTHVPSGITVSMQDERSQHTNRARAFQVLRARLLDRKLQADVTERRETRRKLVKSADRSEKIRTYNFVQGRVTDHRIGLTVKNLPSVLDGVGLQNIVEAIEADYHQGLIEDVLSDE